MNIYVHLLTIEIGLTTYRFTDAGANFDYSGQTYLAGFLKDIPSIEQTGTVKENQVDFELYDLDRSLTTAILSEDYRFKPAVLTRLKLNSDMTVNNVIPLYRGKMVTFSKMTTDDGQTLTIQCKNTAAMTRQRGRRTNVTSQHQVDPTDFCFEKTPFASRDNYWGRKAPTTQTGGGSRQHGKSREYDEEEP
jgi:hypothetical protein